ncbi:MAG: hypothetical protein AAFW68_01605 [Pseudomonadota bacterium]
MNSKNGIIGAIVVVVVVIGAIALFNEADDGPLENAAEDLDDAVEEVSE